MQTRFRLRNGLYRRDGRLHRPGAAAHLWPFSRALVATLDLAGVEGDLADHFDAGAATADGLQALKRYWDPSGPYPAYSSDLLGSRFGGDRYYDDNAWVGLALVQLERMRPGSGVLGRAGELFRFAVSGWEGRDRPYSGGVFWVEQGRGAGARNHDRNTVSTATNAELGLHLAELNGAEVSAGSIRAEDMYEWVLATLDASRESNAPATGPFWDKLCSDGTVDTTIWSYNQGSMVGANVLLARRGGPGQAVYLNRAEAIARRALRHFADDGHHRQPPGFNAIFFRNLLLLHAATERAELRTEIIEAIRGYVDYAWYERRDRRDLFHLPDGGVTLLNQSAAVQLLALLAWDQGSYNKLA
ncbi:MAG: glycoside hydrolase family 76 protein [Actinomycetota bacterium]|nr:glycoside hydrolase family 76 protein [Actinomycetota bacterium]